MCAPTDIENGKAGEAPAVPEVWHVLDIDTCFKELGSSRKGLTTSQAKERFEKYGPNQLSEKKKKTLLQRIWGQINNILVLILAVVAVVSTSKAITAKTTEDMITNWLEVALIVFVITLNAWIGIMQVRFRLNTEQKR
jgi:Ca2+-transporting ATPase